MVTAGSFVSATTALRVTVGCLDLWAQRTPHLVGLAVTASLGRGNTQRAQAEFRDDVLALARQSAELSWREMRRGLDDLDGFTRPHQRPGARPHRPYRMKP